MLETRQLHIANARIKKAVTGLRHKSLTSLRLLKLMKSEWLEKIFNRTYQDVDNVADALKMKQQKLRITVGTFLNFPNFRSLSVLGIQITRVWGYSLPPSGLIEIKRKSCNCIIFFVCSYAYLSRPILVEIFRRYRSYNKMLIDVSLVWLSFMKQQPRCARSVGHDPEPNISSCPTLSLEQWVHSISVLYVTLLSLIM